TNGPCYSAPLLLNAPLNSCIISVKIHIVCVTFPVNPSTRRYSDNCARRLSANSQTRKTPEYWVRAMYLGRTRGLDSCVRSRDLGSEVLTTRRSESIQTINEMKEMYSKGICVLVLSLFAGFHAKSQQQPPNIVFILADD